MAGQRAKKPTPVEIMIIVAVLGIILAIAAGNGQKARRDQPSRSAAPRARVSTEGQGNTIEPPATRRQPRERSSAPPALTIARAVRWALVISVIIWIWMQQRNRGRGSVRRPTRHGHPPEAEE